MLQKVHEKLVEMAARWVALQVVRLEVVVVEHPGQLMEAEEVVLQVMNCAVPTQNEQLGRLSRAELLVAPAEGEVWIVKLPEGEAGRGWRGLLMEVAGDQMASSKLVGAGLCPALEVEGVHEEAVHLVPL